MSQWDSWREADQSDRPLSPEAVALCDAVSKACGALDVEQRISAAHEAELRAPIATPPWVIT